MPSYLTPGVYVEEIPAQSKPIEGVGTSIAAFVGLAPGGPVNRPMRISNWTQFARIYGDPAEPENGPFMAGAYLAHSVYGFFQNGGGLCWIVRVGAADGDPPGAGSPAGGDRQRRGGAAGDGAQGRRRMATSSRDHRGAAASDGDDEGLPTAATYRIVVTAGTGARGVRRPVAEEGPPDYIVTKVNAASKLITLEEIGGRRCPTRRPAEGTYKLSLPAAAGRGGVGRPSEFEGDVAQREGMGGLAAVDEVTMVCVARPDDARRRTATTRSSATSRAR